MKWDAIISYSASHFWRVIERPWTILISAVLAVLLVAAGAGIDHSYSRGDCLGPIQILGGPEEAWIFVERRTMFTRLGWYVRPQNVFVTQSQHVFIISHDGVRRTLDIPADKMVSFDPGVARVFRNKNAFFLIRAPSYKWHGSLFRWQNDHFALLPLEEYHRFLGQMGSDEKWQKGAGPRIISSENGWSILDSEGSRLWSDDRRFEWNGQKLSLPDTVVPPSTVSLSVKCRRSDESWEARLLDVDYSRSEISRSEFNSAKSPENGHPR